MYSSCEDLCLPGFGISSYEWNVVDDVVDESWAADDIDDLGYNWKKYHWSDEPDFPVGPDGSHVHVDVDSDDCDWDEAEEGLEHGFEGGFVDHVFIGSLVGKIEHFVAGDVAIGVGDCPFEFLEVGCFFDLGYDCHVGFGDD
mgnify:CR=1 FL=1